MLKRYVRPIRNPLSRPASRSFNSQLPLRNSITFAMGRTSYLAALLNFGESKPSISASEKVNSPFTFNAARAAEYASEIVRGAA